MKSNIAALYVHIPFCKQRCFYCDFYSNVSSKTDDYVKALICEIKKQQPYRLKTIYFGGGTPSLLSQEEFELIAQAIYEKFDLSRLKEWTIECNPESVCIQKLKTYKKWGINRISFGVQSFDDDKLKKLGRITTSLQVEQAIKQSRDIGFENISADLLVGLEGQTLEQVLSDVSKLIDLGVKHISCYMLMVEEKTKLFSMVKNGEYLPICDETCTEIFDNLVKFLKSKNFSRYEVSNFAQSGYECLHNETYWRREPYLGVGSGACSFYENNRILNTRNLCEYIKGNNEKIIDTLNSNEVIEEIIMLGARSRVGIDLRMLKKYNYDLEKNIKFKEYLDKKIFSIKKDRAILNPMYYNVSNKIILDLL